MKELELKAELNRGSQIDGEIKEMCDCVLDFAANAGKTFKNSKIDEKHQMLIFHKLLCFIIKMQIVLVLFFLI